MRVLTWVGMFLIAAPLLAADDKGQHLTFARADEGKTPSGWQTAKTGEGVGSVWKVTADATGPGKTGYVLEQTAEGANNVFNLCVLSAARYKDLELTVAFKALGGKLDQGGGLVWRYQDAENYYVARMNPLESNFRVYKVESGKRTQLETKEDLKVEVGAWRRLKISQEGNHIRCWLDGEKYLDVKDETFPKAGAVGLWTKADAQTAFDEFAIQPK